MAMATNNQNRSAPRPTLEAAKARTRGAFRLSIVLRVTANYGFPLAGSVVTSRADSSVFCACSRSFKTRSAIIAP